MPQVPTDPRDGWMNGEQLLIPRQHLDASEVDAFLEFLFADVAQRPRPLRLREAAAVVRYLRLLTQFGVPSEVATRGELAIRQYRESVPDEDKKSLWSAAKVAEIIWGDLRDHGMISPSDRTTALRFLETHAESCAWFYAEGALRFVKEFDVPPESQNLVERFVRPPKLRSRGMSASGNDNPHLQDDLSERISAAYQALQRASVPKSRDRIAKALTSAGIQATRRRTEQQTEWGWQHVHERIKQYERTERKRIREVLQVKGPVLNADVLKALQPWRYRLADKWIMAYRSNRTHDEAGQPSAGQA